MIVSLIPDEIMLLVYERKIVHFVFLRMSRSLSNSFSFSVIGLSMSLHSSYKIMKDRTIECQFIECLEIAVCDKSVLGIQTILFISLIASPTFVAWNPVDNSDDTSDSRLAPLAKSSLTVSLDH